MRGRVRHAPEDGRSAQLSRSAAPDADRVGQRRGARAGADVRRRHRRVRRAHERDGREPRPHELQLRRSVGPRRAQRVVGLRHVAPDCLRRRRSGARSDHADAGIRSAHEDAHDPDPQHEQAARRLGTGMDVLGGKTGFISKAGYCLATLLRMPQGPQVAVVVLGAANSTTRFWEARHLFNWVVGRWAGLAGGDRSRIAVSQHSVRRSSCDADTLRSGRPCVRAFRPQSAPARPDDRVRGRRPGRRPAAWRTSSGALPAALEALGHDVTLVAAEVPRRSRPERDRASHYIRQARRDAVTCHQLSDRVSGAAGRVRRAPDAVRSCRALRRARHGLRDNAQRFRRSRRWPRSSLPAQDRRLPPIDVVHAHDWQAGLRSGAAAPASPRWPSLDGAGRRVHHSQPGVSGRVPERDRSGARLAVGRVQRGVGRVLGQVQLPQGRHHVRRLRDDGESDLRGRNAHARRPASASRACCGARAIATSAS